MVGNIKRVVLLISVLAAFHSEAKALHAFAFSSERRNRNFEGAKSFYFGKFALTPKFLFRTTWDDNALFSDDGSQWDFIFNIIPGVDVDLNMKRLSFEMNYDLDIQKNARAGVQDFIGHSVGGELYTTPFGRRVFMRVTDDFALTSAPADDEILERMDVMSNEAIAEVGYMTPGQDLELALAYINNYRDYKEIWDGSTFHGNGVELRSRLQLSSKYRFLPKTHATFDFNYTNASQTFGQDVYGSKAKSNGYRFMLGVVGAFTRKLSLMGKVGYNRTTYNIEADSSDLLVESGVHYYLTRKIFLGAGYARRVEYSVYSPFRAYNNYNFSSNYRPTKKLGIKLKLDFDDITYSNPVTNGAGVQRGDFNTRLNVEAYYRLKGWVNLICGYWLQRRDSNMVNSDMERTSTADFLRNTVYVAIGMNRL